MCLQCVPDLHRDGTHKGFGHQEQSHGYGGQIDRLRFNTTSKRKEKRGDYYLHTHSSV